MLTLFLLLRSITFAGTAALPTVAADADGDGYPVAQIDVNGSGNLDAGDINVAADRYDCDDTDKSVHPGADEIVGDGIDQNCSGSDLLLPVPDPAYRRYVAHEYGGHAPKPELFVAEYERCKVSAHCEPNNVKGRFVIADGGYVFADIYQASSHVLRADGVREVVTKAEASHFRPGGAVPRGGAGIGSKRATEIAKKAAEEAVGVEREAREAADVQQDNRLDALEESNDGRDEVINDLLAAADDFADALEAEQNAREAAIAAERERAQAAEQTAREAADAALETAENGLQDADTALSNGPLVEGYVLGGFVSGAPADVRRMVGGGGGLGLNVGANLESARVNVFADVMVGNDGGSGPMHSESVGIESTFALADSGVHLGPYAAVVTRHSQVDALRSAVVGRGPEAGISLAIPFGEVYGAAAHGLFQARLGCGPEYVGVAGETVYDGWGLGCRATVGIGGGVGALR